MAIHCRSPQELQHFKLPEEAASFACLRRLVALHALGRRLAWAAAIATLEHRP
jgi:hypothetical protein